MGGYPHRTTTEEYNGSTWAVGGTLTTGRTIPKSTGTQTAGLVAGGYIPGGYGATTEEYNGVDWTNGGTMTVTRDYKPAFFGIQTDAIIAGGGSSPNATRAVSEAYDGSSWSSGVSINTARAGLGSDGSSSAGWLVGGDLAPGYTTAHEQWTKGLTNMTVTIS